MALLDTCTFLWLATDIQSISPRAKQVIETSTDLWISAMTVIETHRLLRLKRLEFQMKETDLGEWFQVVLDDFSIQCQSITAEIAHASEVLPWHHKDPADRIIIATANYLKKPLMTPDHLISQYDVEVIW